MKSVKKIIYIISILFTICIFYNLCKSENLGKIEQFTDEINVFEQQNLLQNLEIKPNNVFDTIKSPAGGKVLVQYSNNSNSDTNSDGDDSNMYYKFSTNVKSDTNYKISSWVSTIDNWDGQDQLFNVKMYDKGNKIHALSSNGTVKKTANVAGLNWNYIEYNFTIPKSFKNIIDIFLGYNPKNTKGKRYISDLTIKELVTNLIDFPNISNLILYLDASVPKSYTNDSAYKKYWNNIVNDKTKFVWEKEPKWNNKGYFNMLDTKIVGPSSSQLKLNNK